MSSPLEFRDAVARDATVTLFGPAWRAHRPLENIGGLIGDLITGGWLYQPDALAKGAKLVGEIRGSMRALEAIDEVIRAETGEEKR